ncbi:hypothetical protein PR048_026520 [Dryococelus australis]|uniref:Uncharacterized protein n=1 Tax=Dryococelus australis TaxID=614101 RepID=A0ABQ9GLM1_9NEOP|nr:hypothetical protein PR048_026520 [Dryococelus australis]
MHSCCTSERPGGIACGVAAGCVCVWEGEGWEVCSALHVYEPLYSPRQVLGRSHLRKHLALLSPLLHQAHLRLPSSVELCCSDSPAQGCCTVLSIVCQCLQSDTATCLLPAGAASGELRCRQDFKSHHVGSEVARWQREINQTEQQWFRKIRNGKPEPLKRCVSTSVLTTASAIDDKPKPSLPRVADISKLFETPSKSSVNNVSSKSKSVVKCPKMQPRKQSNVLIISKNFNDGKVSVPEGSAVRNGVLVSDDRKPGVMPQCRQAGKVMEPRVTITCYPKPPCVMTEVAVNGNSRHWDTDSIRSEESTISSIDSEYSPCLPSVKELAKQFSGSNESDSSTSRATLVCLPSRAVWATPNAFFRGDQWCDAKTSQSAGHAGVQQLVGQAQGALLGAVAGCEEVAPPPHGGDVAELLSVAVVAQMSWTSVTLVVADKQQANNTFHLVHCRQLEARRLQDAPRSCEAVVYTFVQCAHGYSVGVVSLYE